MKRTIKDGSLEKIIKYKKYKELFDYSTLECRMAIFSSLIMMIIIAGESYLNGSNEVVEVGVGMLRDIAIELIGFIGFTVSALAILTGVISSRVVTYLKKRSKNQVLERILLSFYMLGLISAVSILLILFFYFISDVNIDSTITTNVIIAGVLAYLLVFQIFYAVKLIGNCLDMFYLVSEMDELVSSDEKHTTAVETYNKYRIISIEKCVLCNLNDEVLEEYKNNILTLICNDDINDEERENLLKMYSTHFGISNDDV